MSIQKNVYNTHYYTHTDIMPSHQRINITLHPIELKKLDKIAKKHNETRSGMIARLIQNHKEISDYDRIGELTELSYELRDRQKDKKKDKKKLTKKDSPKEYEEIGELTGSGL